MINILNVDDLSLLEFCVNTTTLPTDIKLPLFRDQLHSFHSRSELYEHSFQAYSAFITYSVLMNALELNKNILSYEHYYYNVLNGYMTKTGNKVNSKVIAKLWLSLIKVYEDLLDISQKDIISSSMFDKRFKPISIHTDTTYRLSLLTQIPVVLRHVDDYNIFIVFIPKSKNPLTNRLVLEIIQSSNIGDKVVVYSLPLDNSSIEKNTISIEKHIKQFAELHNLSKLVLPIANINNCIRCPLTHCKYNDYRTSLPINQSNFTKVKI